MKCKVSIIAPLCIVSCMPALFFIYADRGCDVLTLPSCWTLQLLVKPRQIIAITVTVHIRERRHVAGPRGLLRSETADDLGPA